MAKAGHARPCPSAHLPSANFPPERACRGLEASGFERARLPCFVSSPRTSCSQLSVSSPAAADGKRVALILGNGEYQHLSSLTNPVRTPKRSPPSCGDHGFEVSEHYNSHRADLLDALETFKRQAQDAEVALVYYAGHGMEIDGKNVVAPTDMQIECANKTTLRSVELDACSPPPVPRRSRSCCSTPADNPFPQCPTRGGGAVGFRGFSRRPRKTARCSSPMPRCRVSLPPTATPASIRPSPSRCSRISTRLRAFLRDLLDLTAKDVRVASSGSQVPEITTRGGSPRVCLDARLWATRWRFPKGRDHDAVALTRRATSSSNSVS